jgi:hypothetical protein
MNKLSKIALVSSLSVLVSVVVISGVVIAQEPNTEPMKDDMSPITTEAPQTKERPIRVNPNAQTRNIERQTKQAESQNISAQNIEKRQSNIITNQEQRAQRIKERCENVGMKIVEHQNKFKSKSQGRIVKYNQITTRLETVSTKLAENGVDVTAYNSYLVELKSKINALNTLNQDYIQLFGSKANTGEFCNNKEQLSIEVDTRKAKLQLVIDKDKEIRMYIKDTIIPYLRSIRPQTQTTVQSTQESLITSPVNVNQILE